MPQQTKPHAQDIICIENQIVWNPEKNNANLLLFNHREKTCTNWRIIICICHFILSIMHFLRIFINKSFVKVSETAILVNWCIFVIFYYLVFLLSSVNKSAISNDVFLFVFSTCICQRLGNCSFCCILRSPLEAVLWSCRSSFHRPSLCIRSSIPKHNWVKCHE